MANKENTMNAKVGSRVLTMDRLREEAKKYPEIDKEAETKYREFSDKFDYKKLDTLDENKLLSFIFPGAGAPGSNLCETLEDDTDFGKITGQNNQYVYGLYKGVGDGKWHATKQFSGRAMGVLTDQDENGEPLRIGKKIREYMVNGAKCIEECIKDTNCLKTESDYIKLYNELNDKTGGMIKQMWLRKYYHMLFPEHFPVFYSDKFLNGVLTSIGKSCDGDRFAKSGRIACYTKECGISNRMMGHLYYVLVTSAKVLENPEKYPKNRIVFGAPGTGKSFLLNEQRKECFAEGNYERVTFYPDYSYANFVGTYKPVMTDDYLGNKDEEWEKIIDILTDKNLKAQEKYDGLLKIKVCKEHSMALAIAVSIYTDNDDAKIVVKKQKDATEYTPGHLDGYGQFVRSYVRRYSGPNDLKSEIAYEFVPGPFMRVYVEARKHPDKSYLLLIEEINRANPAAVFGDVFQLLDRNDDGESMYSIHASEDIESYLEGAFINYPSIDCSTICIPKNMYIWATMNSADQGVYPLDTAFKRRWNFEYIGINYADGDLKGKYVTLREGDKDSDIEWNSLRKAINDFLASKGVNEDKQLGPYYISRSIVVPENGESKINADRFAAAFKDKVIMYLYEDAGRQIRNELFKVDPKTNRCPRYSEICNKFYSKDKNKNVAGVGIKIFCDEIVNNYVAYEKESSESKAKDTGSARQNVQQGESDDSEAEG